MLILSRKPNQSIFINGDIQITVVSIRGCQVRIGIEAPASMVVLRQELCKPARATKHDPDRNRRGGRQQTMSGSANPHRTSEPRYGER